VDAILPGYRRNAQPRLLHLLYHDLLEIGSLKSVFPFEPFLVDMEKGFKMILHAPVIIGRLRVPWTIHSGGCYHDIPPLRKTDRRIIVCQ
jgi:hypothetical protein